MIITKWIQVTGILPGDAYANLKDAPDEEMLISRHRPTRRGLSNAIKRAQARDKLYAETHGNGAAHRIRITVLGATASADYWAGYLDCTDSPITAETIDRYNRIHDETIKTEYTKIPAEAIDQYSKMRDNRSE